jgi:hypothetical protein
MSYANFEMNYLFKFVNLGYFTTENTDPTRKIATINLMTRFKN